MGQNRPIWVHFGAPLRFHIFSIHWVGATAQKSTGRTIRLVCVSSEVVHRDLWRSHPAEPNEQHLGLLTKTDLAVKSLQDGGDRKSVPDSGSGFQIIFV